MSQPPPHQPPHGPHYFPSGPQRSPYGPPAPPDGLSTGAKVALGGASAGTVLLALLLIGYFVWVRPGEGPVVAEPPPSPSASDGTSAAEEDPEESEAQTPGGAQAPEGDGGPGTPPEFPDFEVQEFSGSGRTTVDVEVGEEPVIISVSSKGTGGISVWSVDPEGKTQREVVRRVGDYEGRLLFNTSSLFDTIEGVLIVTDNDWEVSLEPLSAAVHWEATETEYGGSGDEVVQLLWSPNNFSTLDVTYEGESNFFVRSYDNTATSSLVNEIGDYEGQITLTPRTVLIDVQSEGAWTITR